MALDTPVAMTRDFVTRQLCNADATHASQRMSPVQTLISVFRKYRF